MTRDSKKSKKVTEGLHFTIAYVIASIYFASYKTAIKHKHIRIRKRMFTLAVP